MNSDLSRSDLLIVKGQSIVYIISICVLAQLTLSKSTSSFHDKNGHLRLKVTANLTGSGYKVTTSSPTEVQTDFRGNIINSSTGDSNGKLTTTSPSLMGHKPAKDSKLNGTNNGNGTKDKLSPIGSKIEGIHSEDYDDNDQSMWLDLGAYSGDHGSYVNSINSWPSGAPEKTCSTLRPVHGANVAKALDSSTPFTLTQSHQTYQPFLDLICFFSISPFIICRSPLVDLKALTGHSFKGLMVQAYDPSTDKPIGKFLPGRGLKTYDSCSAVTHTDRRGKRGAMLIWEAPKDVSGRVAFKGTIVKRFSEFYEGIKSTAAPKQ